MIIIGWGWVTAMLYYYILLTNFRYIIIYVGIAKWKTTESNGQLAKKTDEKYSVL